MLNFRSSLKKKKVSIGSWVQIPDVYSTEIMAKAGFDWLAIDMEHGPIGLDAVFRLIQVIDLAGSVPLVRLNANDPSTIRRVMDAGAAGVIVPMVNSKENALRAIDTIKYPPQGRRSFGLGRAHRYGENFESYVESANASSVLVVQIEHIDAVKNIDSILCLEGIDAVLIGPYDLSGSMGIPGKFNDKKFDAMVSGIIEKVKKTNKLLGIHIVHPSEKELEKRVGQGFSFIGYGMDTIFLSEAVSKVAKLQK